MAHPILHAKSNQKKFGGKWEDYIHLHNYLDETKAWYGHSLHRMWRHHSEGIFEAESKFGAEFKNSDGKTVYTRYCLEMHVREDCDGQIPSASDWIKILISGERPTWATRTQRLEFED
jgi:hypothetical protein